MAQGAKKTAFVLAGGGSLGAVQVGMLQELLRAGERPDFLVGSSVGALNACYFAGRPDLEGVAALGEIWRKIRANDVFPFTLRSAVGWLSGAGSLFESTGVRELIRRNIPFRALEDAAIPVHVVATNLGGMAVRLSKGATADAILASTAIPVAFPPVRVDGRDLIDGAVAGNTPIMTAAELGASRIIVLPTGFSCSLKELPPGAVARGMHAITLLVAHQLLRDLRLVSDQAEVFFAPNLCPLEVSPLDFDHAAELIERAAQGTRQWLESDGLARSVTPEALAPHMH